MSPKIYTTTFTANRKIELLAAKQITKSADILRGKPLHSQAALRHKARKLLKLQAGRPLTKSGGESS